MLFSKKKKKKKNNNNTLFVFQQFPCQSIASAFGQVTHKVLQSSDWPIRSPLTLYPHNTAQQESPRATARHGRECWVDGTDCRALGAQPTGRGPPERVVKTATPHPQLLCLCTTMCCGRNLCAVCAVVWLCEEGNIPPPYPEAS